MMNIEEQKSAIKGMEIPELIRLYPMAAADQKFLILGEIDRQKKIAAEEAVKQGQNERSVEQDIMQEATGIAAAQNMINRPVSEMETASRYAGIPTQLAENQPEMSPDDLMAAGGVASLDAGRMDLAEGGIIAFDQGGYLPNRPTGFDTNSYTDQLVKEEEELGLINRLRGLKGFSPIRSIFGLDEIEKQKALDLIDEQNKKELRMHSDPTKGQKDLINQVKERQKPKLSDIDVTSEIDKISTEEPKSIFEKSEVPDLDKMYEEEDLTGIAEREAERFKTMMGEDEVTKEARERLAKREERIADREGALTGESIFAAGARMLQSKDPFFSVGLGAGLQEGINRYTAGKKQIMDMQDKSDQLSMDINKIERAEERAANTFGLESEERRRAANEKRRLQKDKAKLDMYKTGLATNLEEQKIDVMRERIKSADRATSAKYAKLLQDAAESVLTKTAYPDDRRALLKKYNGDESNPSFQREDKLLFDNYMGKMISDEDVYGAGNTMSLDPLDADQLLNFGS